MAATPLPATNGLAPTIVEALAELDFGEVEGLRYEDIANKRFPLYAAWMNTPQASSSQAA